MRRPQRKAPTALSVLGVAIKGIAELVDGAWSGFKMFSIGLVGLLDAACRYVITALSTAWGFLKAGIPGARAAWQEGNKGIQEDWKATMDALDAVGVSYMQRQGARWEGWGGTHAKGAAPGPAAGGYADTREHRDKKPPENEYQEELNKLRGEGIESLEKESLAQKENAELEKALLDLEEQRTRYTKELAAGKLSATEAADLRAKAEQAFVDRGLAIDKKYSAERVKIDQETLSKMGVFEAEGVQRRIEEAKREFAAVNAERKKAGLAAIADSVLQSRLQQIDTSRQSGTSGMLAGVRAFVQQSGNAFERWKGGVLSVLGGVQSSFAHVFQGILSGQMNFSQALKSLWKGITSAIIGALANIAAQYIAASVAQAIFGAASTTAASAQTAATTQTAAAETWAAYAPFPFIGQGLATAQIAIMLASIAAAGGASKVVAHAQGGLIDRPMLALMGEVPGSREIVAPETTFKDWAGNLTANIVAGGGERRSMAYQAQGGQYASAAAMQGSASGFGAVQINLSGAVIAGESAESARIIGNLVRKHLDAHSRRNG